jgi:hypothetical protein
VFSQKLCSNPQFIRSHLAELLLLRFFVPRVGVAMAGSSSESQWGWHLRGRPQPRKRGRPDPSVAQSSGTQGPVLDAPRAVPPLRSDAPGRAARSRGALPALAPEEERAEALADFHSGIYAATTRRAMEFKLVTVSAALRRWNLELLPPTCEKVIALGATLKAGGYRSALSYLTLYRGHVERGGFQITGDLNRAFRDARRSCERGLGGVTKSRPLPFSRLGELPPGSDPWTKGGPVGPRNAVVAGSWFLTREIEISTARAALLELRGNHSGSPTMTWHLPATKTDPEAVGCARTHGCTCVGGLSGRCPVHALWDQLLVLKRRFPAEWSSTTGFSWSLPLFPDSTGKAVSKEAMTETIRHAALLLGVPLASPDLTEQVTGHSLRATGAQGFASAGLDEWSIQLLGRWGSKAIRGYTREAALERSSSWAKAVTATLGPSTLGAAPLDLKQIRALLVPLVAEAAQSLFPSLLSSHAKALKGDLVAELKAQQGQLEENHQPEQTLEAPLVLREDSPLPFVKNKATGVVHMLSSSSPSELSARATVCGWRYASRSSGVLLPGTGMCVYKLLCDKCLPHERARRKQALAVA